MATISSLPAETLHHIFFIEADALQRDSSSFRNAYPFLLAVTLVCKAWHEEAQAVLWRRIDISTASRARAFLSDRDRRKWTISELRIGTTYVGGSCDILHACDGRGLRKLQLDNIECTSAFETLCDQKFQGALESPRN